MTARARSLLIGLVIAAGLLAFGWLDVRERARLDRGLKRHRTDFTVYTAASAALYAGENPYEARSPRGYRYVYPPFLAVVMRPFLTPRVEDAAFLWFLGSAAGLAAAAAAMARAIGPPRGRRAVALALLLCGGFLVQSFQRGQVTILLLAAQAGAMLAFLRGRDAAAGLLLALGVAARLTPLLPAGMVGLACLVRLLRGEARRAWRFPAGLAAGLALCFVVVPVAALGPRGALLATEQWLASGREVFASAPGEGADLARDYAITEDIHKNQGLSRVVRWWATGGAYEDRRGDSPSPSAVLALFVVSVPVLLAAFLLAVKLGLRDLASGDAPRARAALAVGLLLPVFLTRYAWPTHYVMAAPFLAEALAGWMGARPGRGGLWAASTIAFALGVAGFYAAHAAPLRWLGDAGVLVAGAAVAVVLSRAALAGARVPRAGGAP